MTTVQEAIRKAQTTQFEQDATLPEELKTESLALYDSIDALSPAQKSLLVDNALVCVRTAIEALATSEDPSEVRAMAIAASGFVAVAGYANALVREAAGDTSTGDSKVSAVLAATQSVMRNCAKTGMTEEEVEIAKAVGQTVKARVDAGEQFETVLHEEVAKFREAHPDFDIEPVAAASAEEDEPPLPGMYL